MMANSVTPAKIMLVDDDPAVRQMLPTYFEDAEDLQVACVASGAVEALEHLTRQQVDLILTDVRMAGVDGIAFVSTVKKQVPHVPVVGITSFEEDGYVVGMLRSGALGVVLKSESREHILWAVREGLSGRAVVSPTLAARLGGYLVPEHCTDSPRLTNREQQVLDLVVDGLSNTEIADVLEVTVSTVKKHVASLLRKFGVDSRLKLAVAALRR